MEVDMTHDPYDTRPDPDRGGDAWVWVAGVAGLALIVGALIWGATNDSNIASNDTRPPMQETTGAAPNNAAAPPTNRRETTGVGR
jgi:hypothetical protein